MFYFLIRTRPKASFFSAPDADIVFRPAVERFTGRVFQLPAAKFFPRHVALLAGLRGLLAPGELVPHAHTLHNARRAHLAERSPAQGEVELVGALEALLWEAAVLALFGAPLQPRFRAARRTLLAALRVSLTEGDFDGTVAGRLLEAAGMPPSAAPNCLLAVLWASLANTVPGAFWAVAFLLLPENARHRAVEALPGVVCRARARVHCMGLTSAGASLDLEALLAAVADKRSALARCVAEALRLRAPGVDVRAAARDLALPAGDCRHVIVHQGEVLAVSPYESHMDERLFGPNAAAYDPDRRALRLGDGSVPGVGGLPGLVFGGGRYRCRGRAFAEAELALVVAVLLSTFEMRLADRPPTPAGINDSHDGCL
ncbi:hypothetical protein WJX81_007055 [Elliptochloris bilobata]|uniref:Cytochrome P450 n=1 Tax=Elliptochloris bilobata TaxID=381761 RepID=A0AAW1RY86_9CHLO